jgi:hypothetical protein
VLALRREDSRYWLLFGLLAGLGSENKHSMLFFGFGLFVGLLLSPGRRALADPCFWLGGAIALALFAPNLVWEYRHHWATLEALRNVQVTGKNVVLSPATFLGQQAFVLLPLTLPVWIAGLWFYGFDIGGRRYRVLAIAYVVTLGLMVALKGKAYYLLPIYPMLFAGGGIWMEKFLHGRPAVAWLKVVYPALLAASDIVFAPMALPVFAGGGLLALPACPGHLTTEDRGAPRRSFTAAFRRHVRLAGNGPASRARLLCAAA